MRLSKGAQALLARLHERARQGRDGYGIQWGIERGPHGGKFRSYGERERLAAIALVKAGLATTDEPYSSQTYRNGYASHHTSITIRLKAKEA